MIRKPVVREIFAAQYRDRVVHHVVFDSIYDWWDRRFLYDVYSCRVGKGTLMGIERLYSHIEKASQGFRMPTYVLKMDIKGYFMSINRKSLLKKVMWGLEQQFKGLEFTFEFETLKFLITQIIMDDPAEGAIRKGPISDWDDVPPSKSLFCQAKGVGIVIGNLTSQLFSNIFLNELDRFIYYKLGYKHYGRYVDDFYVVLTEDQVAKMMNEDVPKIAAFLSNELGLTLHPNKTKLYNAQKELVPFLGARTGYGRVLPGERTLSNAFNAFLEVEAGIRSVDSVASYMGHMKGMNSTTFLCQMFEKMGWEYNI